MKKCRFSDRPMAHCLAVIALLAFSGCGREPEGASEPPDEASHAQMLDLLVTITGWATHDHPILGDREARRLSRELDSLKTATARDAPSVSTLRLYSQLGRAELRLGNLDQGLEHYAKAHDGLKQLGEKHSVPPTLDLEAAYDMGIAHMRRGETKNCCQRNSPDSCLLPIEGSGIHTNQEPSKHAIAYFTKVLQKAPQDRYGSCLEISADLKTMLRDIKQ